MGATFIATMIAIAWCMWAARVSNHFMQGKNLHEKLTLAILIGFPTAVALIMFIMTLKE